VGINHFKEWTVAHGTMKSKAGSFNKHQKIGSHCHMLGSCCFNGNECLTGATNGELYVWNDMSIRLVFEKYHDRLIDAITIYG
jgi:hypothetical protein